MSGNISGTSMSPAFSTGSMRSVPICWLRSTGAGLSITVRFRENREGDENSISRAAYASAKAGVLGFTRGLARELAPKITVNAICPGLVLNPSTQELLDKKPEMIQ